MMFDGTRCKLKPDDFVEEARLFFQKLHDNPNHRFRSWEHCYEAFQEAFELKDKGGKPNIDLLCLHLAFYLASWGMYRGSSFLLWCDYKVHKEIVGEILEQRKLASVSCEELCDPDSEAMRELVELYKKVVDGYKPIKQRVDKEHPKNSKKSNKEDADSATATLVTKILLGTLGCVPALDSYVVAALSKYGIWRSCAKEEKEKLFGYRKAIVAIAQYYCDNMDRFDEARKGMKVGGAVYPPMKFMDMGLWTIGKKIEEQKKSRKS